MAKNRVMVAVFLVLGTLLVTVATAPAATGYTWTRQTSGTTEVLLSVEATSLNEIWAVGFHGEILRYDGTVWREDPQSGMTQGEALTGVFSLDATHTWAVGWDETILFHNGSNWVQQLGPIPAQGHDLKAVGALDAKHVWAVGQPGVRFFDGTQWAPQPCGFGGLNGVVALDATHVWAVGDEGVILRYDGTSWKQQESGTNEHLQAVCALDANHVWAVGSGGVVLFYNGKAWLTQVSGTTSTLRGVSAADTSHVWAVGDPGTKSSTVLFFNGKTWARQNIGGTNGLFGVTTPTPSRVWLVGDDGSMYMGSKPVIAACEPLKVHQGDEVDFYVRGVDTHFRDGQSRVTASGRGLAFGPATTKDSVYAKAKLTVAGNAPTGARDINVVTGSEVPVPLKGGLTVYRSPDTPPHIDAVTPRAGAFGDTVHVTGRDFGAFQGSSSVSFNGTTADVDVWSDTSITCEVPRGAASGLLRVVTPWGSSSGFNFRIESQTFFFAEGTTRPDFDTYFCILNPGVESADVRITYMKGDGSTDSQTLTVAQGSRATVNARDTMGTGDDTAHDFSAVVESLEGANIVVERPMYFDYQGMWTGGHDVIGAVDSHAVFYFAEGTTRPDFDTYYCILNPGTSAEDVRITYMKGDGTSEVQDVRVGAHSRATVNARDRLGTGDDASHDFSALVESASGRTIVAERPMYFNYKGVWTGGHDAIGETHPDESYFFAEGTTRPDFDTYYCIFNPGTDDAQVRITYMRGNKTNTASELVVPAGTRVTVAARDTLGTGDDPAHDFSAVVESLNGVDIIAERPMYFDYKGVWTGGHDVVGSIDPDTYFYFAEGTTRPGFDTYFCVMNPKAWPADVKITYFKGDGTSSVQELTVPAMARSTVCVNAFLGAGDDAAHDFSARVESTNRIDIVAERPMYFDYQGKWTGGHDVVGF